MNKSITNNPTIVQYIRKNANENTKGEPVGVLVAGIVDNVIRVGWSLAKVRNSFGPCDVFNRRKGLAIAVGRADVGSNEVVPPSILDEYNAFENRAKRYFQGCYLNREMVLPENLRAELMAEVE